MIGAVMALMHLHGAAAERDAEHLMAETDAECRHAVVDHAADHWHRVFAGFRRIAGAVRQEYSVRLQRDDVFGRSRRRHHRNLAAARRQQPQDIALHAVIDRDHMEIRFSGARISLIPDPFALVPGEALRARHHRHEVHADKTRPFARFFLQRFEIEFAGSLVRDHGIGHALLSNECSQGAGVDAGEPDDAAALEPLIEMARGAVVGGIGDRALQDHPARARRGRHVDGFDVFFVGADIADMREGEGDDLPGVGGIGEDFLVTRHRGIEADLADGGAGGAEAKALEYGAIGQHEEGGGLWFGPAGIGYFWVHKPPR